MKPFKIRNIEINPPLVLSPMAGVTDYSFRRMAKRRGGIGLTVSEFISVEGLTRNNPKGETPDAFLGRRTPVCRADFRRANRANGWRRKWLKKSARIFGYKLRLSRAEGRQKRRRFGLLRDLPRLETILKKSKKRFRFR
jgi:tRNA-dihydrouridine synthase B